MRRTILITDGEQRAALAIVRSLGRAGCRCVVGSSTGRSLSGASRFATADIPLPDPGVDPVGYLTAVSDAIRQWGAEMVIPVAEPSLLAILPARDRIGAIIPFPEQRTFEAICNKEAVLHAASRLGIAIPKQFTVFDDAASLPDGFELPVVLKPTRSVYTAPDGTRGKVGVRWARTMEEFRNGLQAYPESAFPILVQEAIEGEGIGMFVLMHRGDVFASFAHQRLREKPPSGGVSVLRQSAPMDFDLLGKSVELLRSFGWSGVAMVEYKRESATQRACLMEINGRFWGSLQLAVDAGVDLPLLLAQLSFGEVVSTPERYRAVRSRWFFGDLDNLIAQLRDHQVGWRGRARAIIAWFAAFGPGYKEEILRWSDPKPFMRESIDWLEHLVGR